MNGAIFVDPSPSLRGHSNSDNPLAQIAPMSCLTASVHLTVHLRESNSRPYKYRPAPYTLTLHDLLTIMVLINYLYSPFIYKITKLHFIDQFFLNFHNPDTFTDNLRVFSIFNSMFDILTYKRVRWQLYYIRVSSSVLWPGP